MGTYFTSTGGVLNPGVGPVPDTGINKSLINVQTDTCRCAFIYTHPD